METYYIYKICCKDESVTDDIYIGSSKNIKDRTRSHKTNCNNQNGANYNIKIYQKIREFGGWDNWLLIVLEKLPNATKSQATIREEELRVQLNATLNTNKASTGFGYIGLTKLESHREWCKIHYQQNSEKRIEYQKEYDILNKEKKRLYRENNTEKIKEQKRLYRAKMKAKRVIENTNDMIV